MILSIFICAYWPSSLEKRLFKSFTYFNWVICFCVVELQETSLYILNVTPFLICNLKIFSSIPVNSLFTLLIVFCCIKDFKFDVIKFTHFYFVSVLLVLHPRNHSIGIQSNAFGAFSVTSKKSFHWESTQCHKIFILCFPLRDLQS